MGIKRLLSDQTAVNLEPPVIIAVGYSVRALVEACAVAGLQAIAVDHFGDADTRVFAAGRWIELKLTEEGRLADETQASIQVAACEFHQQGRLVAFLLAGGMENLGVAVEQLNCIAPVLGPSEGQRRQLRNIDFLKSVAEAVGIRIPEVSREPLAGKTGAWLWKPSNSAGGLLIARSNAAEPKNHDGYWQAFVNGRQLGVCCILKDRGCKILGATLGLEASEWPGPTEFIYRGSYGPIRLPNNARKQILGLCEAIQMQLGLIGWLQFDFVRGEDGFLWLLECNPRWTAGMEALLHGDNTNAVCEHLHVFGHVVSGLTIDRVAPAFFGKAVIYAKEPLVVNAKLIQLMESTADRDVGRGILWLADIPFVPQPVECGHPIATVRAKMQFETGYANQEEPSEEDARSQILGLLQARAKHLWRTIQLATASKGV